jgi:hypothetical protein
MIQERKKPPRNVSKGVILLVVALGLGILRAIIGSDHCGPFLINPVTQMSLPR